MRNSSNRAGDDPDHAPGNRVLIRQREIHQSPNRAIRQNAVPILFFRRVAYEGRAKGNVVFQGLGVIQRAELITQYNSKVNDYFSNLVFEFAVLSLSHEKERLQWEWIKARRDSSKTLEETHRLAPEAWKRWVNEGPTSIEKYRRRVSKLLIENFILKPHRTLSAPLCYRTTFQEHQAQGTLFLKINFRFEANHWSQSGHCANHIHPLRLLYSRSFISHNINGATWL